MRFRSVMPLEITCVENVGIALRYLGESFYELG
jgi:hypothetical protein